MMSGLRIKEREKNLLIIAAILILVTVFYIYFYKPQQSYIDKQTNLKISLDDKLAVLKDMQENYQKYQTQIIEYGDIASPYVAAMPTESNTSKFAVDIEDMAAQNNLQLAEFKSDSALDKGEYKQIPLKITLVGEYGSLLNFVKGLDELPRIISYRGWDLQPKDNKEDKYTLSIDMTVYSSK